MNVLPPVRNSRLALLLLPLLMALFLTACGGSGDDKEANGDATTQQDDAKAKDGAKPGEDGKQKKEDKPVPVEIAQVTRRPIEASYHGTAALEAPNEAQVVAKTSGVLLELLVEEGDRVKPGQVLARLDSERARLEVQRAEATLRKLEAEKARSKELFERKLVAEDLYEKIRFDVETQRAAHGLAKLELSYASIVAPIGGVIAQRMVKKGNLIQLNAPLFRIVDADRLEAVLNVPERELATLQEGLEVRMEVDAIPGRPFTGTIDRISPVVDAGSGTFRVTCEFDSLGKLKPGMFGRIGVVYDQRSDVLTVPRSALLDDAGESAVYAVRDGAAVRVPIELGFMNGEVAEIRAGLVEGDSVVTAGKVTLRDGSKVEVLNPLPQADPSTTVAQSDTATQTAMQP